MPLKAIPAFDRSRPVRFDKRVSRS